MEQLDLIGFLDTVGYSTVPLTSPIPDRLIIRFDRVGEGQQIVDASSNDISRLTNLFRTVWVVLSPDDILSYRTANGTSTLLIRPAAISVEPGKNTDIYNLFAIKGTVGERLIGQQAAVEVITSPEFITLPTDPGTLAQINQATRTTGPELMGTSEAARTSVGNGATVRNGARESRILATSFVPIPIVVSPTGMRAELPTTEITVDPVTGQAVTVMDLAEGPTVDPIVTPINMMPGQPGQGILSSPAGWMTYWNPM